MAKAVAESDRMADQSAFERALKESEDDELQRAIKESSMAVDSVSQIFFVSGYAQALRR